jgi:hypothetical protein
VKLPSRQGIHVIEISNIVRKEAISNYSKLYFTNGKTLVVAKVLSDLKIILQLQKKIPTIYL